MFSRRSGGPLEFLHCISRVSKGSELTALQRLGQAEVIAPVKVDVLVHQRRKTLDVLVLEHVALGAQLVEDNVHVPGVPERDCVDNEAESSHLIFLSFPIGLTDLALLAVKSGPGERVPPFLTIELDEDLATVALVVDDMEQV